MGHRWRGYEHAELFDMINSGPGSSASDPQTTYWQDLAKELTEVDQDLNTRLNNLGSRWEGQAAENAQTGLTPLATWASDAETGATIMKVSTENQGEYIVDARARMPEPVAVTTPAPSGWDYAAAAGAAILGMPGPAVGVAQQAEDHEQQEAAKNEAELRAVETMQTYESSSEWNRDTLGTFVAPPDVVVETPEPQSLPSVSAVQVTEQPGYDPTGRTVGPAGGGDNQQVTTGSGGSSNPPTVNTDQTDGGGGGGGGGGQTLPPNPQQSGTTPANVVAPAANLPLPTPSPNPLPTPTPNALPTGGGPFPMFGAGDPSLNAGDAARRAMPLRAGLPSAFAGESALGRGAGAPALDGERALGRGGAIGETAVVRNGPGAAGAAGRGGNGVHGPLGRRAEDEEDEEYLTPNYLIETDDVFGDERHVSPTVIGE
jgi:hypothetical protein